MKYKFSKAYPSPFLREPDLGGKDVPLTIKGWRYVDPKKDVGTEGRKLDKGTVLSFEESDKEMVANVTNFRTIAGIHGPDPDEWVGKKVTLYPATTRLGKDPKAPCIRIRNIDPATGKAPEAW